MDFDTLYKEHYQRIYRFAFRMAGSAEEAKDIVQETFVKLHGALGSGSEIRQPRTWLYTVAANICRNSLKRQAHYRDVVIKEVQPQLIQESVEADLIRRERIELMKKAIASLPERDRTLLMLYQDRLPYAEMADVIGVKAGSVGTLLSRAIEKLATASKNGIEL